MFGVLHDKMTAGAFVPGVYDSYTNAEYHAADGISKKAVNNSGCLSCY